MTHNGLGFHVLAAFIACRQGDPAFAKSAVRDKSPPRERKRTPFFGAFFKQLLDPSVSVNDRVTEFFAAALGKAISKMYESMGESVLRWSTVGLHTMWSRFVSTRGLSRICLQRKTYFEGSMCRIDPDVPAIALDEGV